MCVRSAVLETILVPVRLRDRRRALLNQLFTFCKRLLGSAVISFACVIIEVVYIQYIGVIPVSYSIPSFHKISFSYPPRGKDHPE